MTIDEYQTRALTTVITHPDPLMDKTIWAMGVAGEAGEVIEKWKKIVAYKDGVITDDDLLELSKEIGDVLWYLAVFANSLGLQLDDIAAANIAKLTSRKSRGVTKGQGDNR
jgi:NTP pyrophosphatase (non-canonical NTP hydrolase)